MARNVDKSITGDTTGNAQNDAFARENIQSSTPNGAAL
jgi:hypothetical protein